MIFVEIWYIQTRQAIRLCATPILSIAFMLLTVALFGPTKAAAQGETLFALGNRVWFDTDNSGTINNAEVGIDGVTLKLYAANDLTTSLDTQITANGGYYLFNNLSAGDYVVAVDAANFSGVLSGYRSSGSSRTPAGALVEVPAALADTDVDSDDNGLRQTSGTLNGAVISSTVTLAAGINEPTGETDLDNGAQGQPDNQANMTLDFGFYSISLVGLVWNDGDNNGQREAPESGIDNVTVALLSGDASLVLDTTTTASGGIYTFSGLAAGEYLIRLPAIDFNPGGVLRDYRSSTGLIILGLPYEPAPHPDTDTADNDDNGTETNGLLGLGGYIQTLPFSLSPAAEESFDNATGTTSESRVDFGVNNTPQIDLSITKTDNQQSYVVGETLHYVITVTNNGPADADGMTIIDTRPAQISSWTWTCASPNYNCSDDVTNPAIFTDTLSLPQLASVTYYVTAQVGPVVSGELINRVFAIPPPDMSDLTPWDNVAEDRDSFAEPILEVTKTASPNPAAVGNLLTYSLQVTNTGTADAVNLTLTDPLPSPLSYRSASGAGWSCAFVAGVVSCSHPLLAPGSAPPITIEAVVLYATTASLNNSVQVTATNTQRTATASASTRITQRPMTADVLPVPAMNLLGLLVTGFLLMYGAARRLK